MKLLGIIPARYASTRLPGKPLADIGGKPMIQHVYERASQAITTVVVATDDKLIVEAVERFGGKAMMTDASHTTGTNRCLEVVDQLDEDYDVVVNIQGDEPLLEPELLTTLTECFEDPSVRMATLAVKVTSPDDLFNENRVFLVKDKNDDALYFSRSPLPHVRGEQKEDWIQHSEYFRHVGLYAYTPEALRKFAKIPPSHLEKMESLEQLRWLEAGEKIRVKTVSHGSISVDTPADLEKVRQLVKAAHD